jgi:hypothetical protein
MSPPRCAVQSSRVLSGRQSSGALMRATILSLDACTTCDGRSENSSLRRFYERGRARTQSMRSPKIEERELAKLLDQTIEQGRRPAVLSLPARDIFFLLDETAISETFRELAPSHELYPGHDRLRELIDRSDEHWKTICEARFGIPKNDVSWYGRVADRMRQRGASRRVSPRLSTSSSGLRPTCREHERRSQRGAPGSSVAQAGGRLLVAADARQEVRRVCPNTTRQRWQELTPTRSTHAGLDRRRSVRCCARYTGRRR